MSNTILQVPMDKTIREKATKAVKEKGFSSLQDVFRLLATELASGSKTISVSVQEPVIKLSKRASRRYDKIIDDYKKGKNIYHAKDIDDLMSQLTK